MQTGSVQRLIATFQQAFGKLRVDVSSKKLEDLAITVHKAMTVQARHFHNLEHVFAFLNPENPIQSLAALYHDIVYYQVDMGFSPAIWESICPYINEDGGEIYICENPPGNDRLLDLTLEVFYFHPGQKLSPVGELNEFFSALVMNKQLDSLLGEKDLLKMTLCIEATIPFRGRDENGQSHFDVLEQRLRVISQRRQIPFSESEITESIQLAVMFANKDIENFGEANPRKFIENTWKLLPEMNVALRARDVYSIREYRKALQRMEDFLSNLNPANVFNKYGGIPSEEEYELLTSRAYQNIAVARDYSRVKLLAIGILDAFAMLTGGDAPISLFMGDWPEQGRPGKHLEDFLPSIPCPPWIDQKSYIYRILTDRNPAITTLDVRYSPLALFVYQNLKAHELEKAMLAARQMFAGQLPPIDFLAYIGRPTVSAVAQASSWLATTRREALFLLADRVPATPTDLLSVSEDKQTRREGDTGGIRW